MKKILVFLCTMFCAWLLPAQVPQVVNESTAEILLLSGNSITVQIVEMTADHVSYTQDGRAYMLPADQINKVTFVLTGQTRTYKDTYTAPAPTPQKTETTTATQPTPKTGRIYRDSGEYIYNGVSISGAEVERILKRENTIAHKHWTKADGMMIGAAVCYGIGGGLLIGSIYPFAAGFTLTGGIICLSAVVPLAVGIGLNFGSIAQYNKAINIYNSKYDHAAVQLKWRIAPDGIGVALAF